MRPVASQGRAAVIPLASFFLLACAAWIGIRGLSHVGAEARLTAALPAAPAAASSALIPGGAGSGLPWGPPSSGLPWG